MKFIFIEKIIVIREIKAIFGSLFQRNKISSGQQTVRFENYDHIFKGVFKIMYFIM